MQVLLRYERLVNCASLLLVPSNSKRFHLQTSEMQLFMTIAIANVAFCWAMVLQVQLLPVGFLFFYVTSFLCPAYYRYFQVVPGCSNSFQLVPACFRCFQLIPAGSSTFIVFCSIYIINTFT